MSDSSGSDAFNRFLNDTTVRPTRSPWHQRPLGGLLLILLLAGSGWLWHWSSSEPVAHIGAPDGLDRQRRPRPEQPPVNGAAADLARAYALLGAIVDARRPASDLEGLPAAITDQLPAARALLARQPVSNWQRRAAGEAARVPVPLASTSGAGPAEARRAEPTPSSSGERALPPGHRWPPSPEVLRRPPGPDALNDLSTGLQLHEPGLVLDKLLLPEQLPDGRFDLQPPPASDYVIQLTTDDAGGLRLDGGLVVPGRWYLADEAVELRIAAPTGLAIRPVDQVTGYHPGPAAIPLDDG